MNSGVDTTEGGTLMRSETTPIEAPGCAHCMGCADPKCPAKELHQVRGLLGAANNALSHQASILSAKDRELAAARSATVTPINKTAAEFADFLVECSGFVAQGPGIGYRERTIQVEIWDHCDDGGENVGDLNFTISPEESADLIAALRKPLSHAGTPQPSSDARAVELLREARDEFIHLAEYWNGNTNASAMQDACEHTLNEAEKWRHHINDYFATTPQTKDDEDAPT